MYITLRAIIYAYYLESVHEVCYSFIYSIKKRSLKGTYGRRL